MVSARTHKTKRGMNLLFLNEATSRRNEDKSSISPTEPGMAWDVENTWGMAKAVKAHAKRPTASLSNSLLARKNNTKMERYFTNDFNNIIA